MTSPALPRMLLTLMVCLLAWAPAKGVEAQQGEIIPQLAGIRSSLAAIAELLREQTTLEEKSLTLRRIEMKNDRLLPIDAEIRNSRDAVGHLDGERARLETYLARLDQQLLDADPGSEQARRLTAERQPDEDELERVKSALWAQTLRLQDLEVERNDLEAEVRSLEARLDGNRP